MSTTKLGLLATDFDGTVFRFAGESNLYPRFAGQIRDIRQDGARWLVCTGRSIRSLRSATRRMAYAGVTPDFVLTRHSFFFAQRNGFWFPQLSLTLALWQNRAEHRRRTRTAVRAVASTMRSAFRRCRISQVSTTHVRMQFHEEADAEAAWNRIDLDLFSELSVRVTREGRDIDLRGISMEKGIAVSCVARHLGVPPDRVLSIGDGNSDASMMDARVAGMTGCPLNAKAEVIRKVVERGGHIAKSPSLDGTIEVLDAYLSGQVNSVPPLGWNPLSGTGTNEPQSLQPRHLQKRKFEVVLIAASIVVGILVLAAFDLVPFGSFILWPFTFVVEHLFGV